MVSADDPGRYWQQLADLMGESYLRYSFTKGTVQEVDFLVTALGLRPGMRVLDVGCGPGRHSLELSRRGVRVVGVDIAEAFLVAARHQAAELNVDHPPEFRRGNARELHFDAEFDAVISLCQGGIGLGGADPIAADLAVLEGIRRALRPGAGFALSAFNAYFQVRWLEDTDTFDADTGVNHETTTIHDRNGTPQPAELWTTCSTPRELRLLCAATRLTVDNVFSVTPGAYAATPPTIDSPELLVLGRNHL